MWKTTHAAKKLHARVLKVQREVVHFGGHDEPVQADVRHGRGTDAGDDDDSHHCDGGEELGGDDCRLGPQLCDALPLKGGGGAKEAITTCASNTNVFSRGTTESYIH